MPEYLSPGVYVEEVDTGNKPIEGVSTSTVGFLGLAERGPRKPTLVGSFSEYARTFGKYINTGYMPYAVEGFFQNGGKRCFIARVAPADAATASTTLGGVTVHANGPGDWPNGRLAIKADVAGSTNPNAPAGSPALYRLSVFYWDSSVSLPTGGPIDPTVAANLTNPAYRAPTMAETFDNLSVDPNSANFSEVLINNVSDLITVASPAGAAAPTLPTYTVFSNGTAGSAVTLTDFEGDPQAEPGTETGLLALGLVDEISILCCPDEHGQPGGLEGQLTNPLVQQCENLRYRFAILQSAQNPGPASAHYPPAAALSKYAGYYTPWLTILDPVSQKPRTIPPCGHLAGIYARSDDDRGVHKAPANEPINGLYSDPQNPAAGLQSQINKAQQDFLNPRGVNALRYFPGRGNLVWGARTTSPDPDWKYINVRRLFIFIEKSIDQGTQWVVFEPNDAPLWARVVRSVSDFLTRVWMDGMLQGATKEQAYFVRCDRTTMTQADIDNGRLIILVGIAPVKPAEFVIFRIGQWTGGVDTATS